MYFIQMKYTGIELLFKKKPPNIINGVSRGPVKAKAIWTFGARADTNDPIFIWFVFYTDVYKSKV